MLYGFKSWENGMLHLRVEGYPKWRFVFYTEREAVREYRKRFHLERRKIHWLE